MKLVICLCLILTSASIRAVRAQSPPQPPLSRLQIKEAERLLTERGYWTGVVDGRFDPGTQSALIAFQKWKGRAVTGKLTFEEIETIRTSSSPGARETGYAHVEVDLDRQVMLDRGRARRRKSAASFNWQQQAIYGPW
jgi:peptidoglycan hydrolase-like protein with peptidoglycan-binding domain